MKIEVEIETGRKLGAEFMQVKRRYLNPELSEVLGGTFNWTSSQEEGGGNI